MMRYNQYYVEGLIERIQRLSYQIEMVESEYRKKVGKYSYVADAIDQRDVTSTLQEVHEKLQILRNQLGRYGEAVTTIEVNAVANVTISQPDYIYKHLDIKGEIGGVSGVLRGIGLKLPGILDDKNNFLSVMGMDFEFINDKAKGIVSLRLKNFSGTYDDFANAYRKGFGKYRGYNKVMFEEFKTTGIQVYSKTGGYMNKSKFELTRYVEELSKNGSAGINKRIKYLKNIPEKFSDIKMSNLRATFASEFKDNFKPKNMFGHYDIFDKKVFKKAKTLTKVAKFAGVVGDGLAVYESFSENMFDENGEFDPSLINGVETIKDVGIGLVTSSATTAAGAAIGSLFAPPVGTVVGIGAGMALDAVINYKCIGDPPKNLIESAENFIIEKAGDITGAAGDALTATGDKIQGFAQSLAGSFW